MKRIELFEEGLFFTFVIDGKKLFLAISPLNVPFREANSRSIPLPPCDDLSEDSFSFCGYEDTGNQTGRAVTLSFIRDPDGTVLKLIFQFQKGCGAVSISVSGTNGDEAPFPQLRPFRSLLENCLEGISYSVREDGSELFSLSEDIILNEKEVCL